MKLALVNQSKRVTTSQMAVIRAGLRGQGHQFGKAWGFLQPTLTASATADAVTLLVVDNPDVANALGYHDVDPQGKPYGRVFVDPVLDNGGSVVGDHGDPSLSVSAVCSHEFLEWWLDPGCQLWADAGRKSIAYEVADPVEQDSYMMPVGPYGAQVAVSNFVLPAWFVSSAPGPYDFLAKLSKPFTMTPGGYFVQMADGTAQQVFASSRAEFARLGAAPALAPTKHHPASRTYRRLHTAADS